MDAGDLGAGCRSAGGVGLAKLICREGAVMGEEIGSLGSGGPGGAVMEEGISERGGLGEPAVEQGDLEGGGLGKTALLGWYFVIGKKFNRWERGSKQKVYFYFRIQLRPFRRNGPT